MVANLVKNIAVFSDSKCRLGESPVWHPQRGSFFWLDILSNKLFEKNIEQNLECFWDIEPIPSTIVLDNQLAHCIWILTDQFFGRFDLLEGVFVHKIPIKLDSTMRTNDGFVGPDGTFVFGSMQKSPSNQIGELFSVNSQGTLTLLEKGWGIPNTFCWESECELIVSDSFSKSIFRYEWSGGALSNRKLYTKHEFFGSSAPDGGAIDSNGNLFLASWGDGCVLVFNSLGVLLETIDLPIEQPSSCAFGGKNMDTMLVTSAYDKLKSPSYKDGHCYLVEFEDVIGKMLPGYGVDNAY